jgi:hypothetical protein
MQTSDLPQLMQRQCCFQAVSEYEYRLRLQDQIKKDRQAKLRLLDGILFGSKSVGSFKASLFRKAFLWAAAHIVQRAQLKISDIQIKVSDGSSLGDGAHHASPDAATTRTQQGAPATILLTVGEVSVNLRINTEPQNLQRGLLTFCSMFELHGVNLSTSRGMGQTSLCFQFMSSTILGTHHLLNSPNALSFILEQGQKLRTKKWELFLLQVLIMQAGKTRVQLCSGGMHPAQLNGQCKLGDWHHPMGTNRKWLCPHLGMLCWWPLIRSALRSCFGSYTAFSNTTNT